MSNANSQKKNRITLKSMSNIYLPLDLWFDVLVRLPVDDVLRFKSVSKSWATLIDSPQFIRYFQDHKHRIIFDAAESISESQSSLQLFAGSFDSPAETLYCPQPSYETRMKLVGSCNGLVCIRYVRYGIVLCNPMTRKHKKLPRSAVEIVFPDGRIWNYTVYGFGYDDVEDDYKVVRVVGVRDKISRRFSNEVKIYSLKSNSWRRLVDLPYTIPETSGVLVNRAVHWLLNEENRILAIDLCTEESRLLLPPRCGSVPTRNLGVSDSCLCLCESSGHDYQKSLTYFKIWLMKDYGVEDSWTTLTIEIKHVNYFGFPNFIGYSENDKQLIFDDCSVLFWYDVEKKVLHKTPVPGGVKNLHYFVASLVQPGSTVRSSRGRR